jgi:hypothetical protein
LNLTEYHAAYYAHELSRRHSLGDSEKIASALADANVDLNPHQVDAALFAFRSPLSKGCILADEVGLGKTIEAGLVIAQKWSEQKRRILIVTPANLRKQWSMEMQDKFYLPACILEAKNYQKLVKDGCDNPFLQSSLVICSYQFAAKQQKQILAVPWDLAVIDESHRLRNVSKPDNKIAKAIKSALGNTQKLLLTATPLQNSLLELYGLVSVIDDYAFGDEKSFKAQYARLNSDATFDELKARLAPICHRTLRRQVLEYIRYTNRIPLKLLDIPFDFPKPSSLIKFLMSIIGVKKDDIVLDFFAGSCPLGHAALELSSETKEAYPFICVQLPEKVKENSEEFKAGYRTIADIGKERIRRVIQKLNAEQEGKLDLEGDAEQDRGFRVLKLDQSNFKPWQPLAASASVAEIEQQLFAHVDHLETDATPEDLLFEILLKAGFAPTANAEQRMLAGIPMFSVAEGALLICLADGVSNELIDAVVAENPQQFICLDAAFGGNDQLKSNAVQTFKAHNLQKEKHNQIVFKTV